MILSRDCTTDSEKTQVQSNLYYNDQNYYRVAWVVLVSWCYPEYTPPKVASQVSMQDTKYEKSLTNIGIVNSVLVGMHTTSVIVMLVDWKMCKNHYMKSTSRAKHH